MTEKLTIPELRELEENHPPAGFFHDWVLRARRAARELIQLREIQQETEKELNELVDETWKRIS